LQCIKHIATFLDVHQTKIKHYSTILLYRLCNELFGWMLFWSLSSH